MSEDIWKTNIFYPVKSSNDLIVESSPSSSSSLVAGSRNHVKQTATHSSIDSERRNNKTSTQSHQEPQNRSKGGHTSRRRACDHCVRRRSRCDGERPCKACQLHATESTCFKQSASQINENQEHQHASVFQRACRNCWSRKSKCDQTYPCLTCISRGLHQSCYQELGVERDALQQLQEEQQQQQHQQQQQEKEQQQQQQQQQVQQERQKTAASLSEADPSTRKQVSKRACYNCWYRKNKCSKQRPCTSCVFHHCADSCFVELDQDSDEAEKVRQKMNEKRKVRAKAKSIAHAQNKERRGSSSTPTSTPYASNHPISVSVPQLPQSPHSILLHQSWTKLSLLPDIEKTFSLVGNFDLANDWPTIDEEVIQSTMKKIRSGNAPDAIEIAYIYVLLAVCAIALPTLHPFKAVGQILQEENIHAFKQEAIALISFVSDPNNMGSSTPTPLLECRVFHALAWICMYSQQSKEAYYFSEQSILSARLANIINGFSDPDTLYSKEEVQQRKTSRAIVFEVFSLAEWISFSSGFPSSIPPLSEDIKAYATSCLHEKDILPSIWKAWKLHSSTWMGNALRYEREIRRKNDDGTDRMSEEQKDESALRLIRCMEEDEKQIDDSTQLLSAKLSTIEIKDNVDNVVATRRNNAKLAAQYTTYIIRNMVAGRSLENGVFNVRLSGIALDAVFKLVNDLPNLVACQYSQHQFPPLKHFLAKMFEAGMQTTFGAINRLKDVQRDYELAKQMSSLLLIVPRSYTMMNQHGIAGPFSFAVQSICSAVPIQRPITMINDGSRSNEYVTENESNHQINNQWHGQEIQQFQPLISPFQWNSSLHNAVTILPIHSTWNQFEHTSWNEQGQINNVSQGSQKPN